MVINLRTVAVPTHSYVAHAERRAQLSYHAHCTRYYVVVGGMVGGRVRDGVLVVAVRVSVLWSNEEEGLDLIRNGFFP